MISSTYVNPCLYLSYNSRKPNLVLPSRSPKPKPLSLVEHVGGASLHLGLKDTEPEVLSLTLSFLPCTVVQGGGGGGLRTLWPCTKPCTLSPIALHPTVNPAKPKPYKPSEAIGSLLLATLTRGPNRDANNLRLKYPWGIWGSMNFVVAYVGVYETKLELFRHLAVHPKTPGPSPSFGPFLPSPGACTWPRTPHPKRP